MERPDWATFIPEIGPAAISRHLPTHEDCARLDVEAIATHLKKGGTLGSMAAYEERPGQIDMTRAIASAFNERKHLMIEAGTGVGKSLAYLIPAIHWSAVNDTPVVISTATRNLQSQLLSSDIPRALETLDESTRRSFKVALLKGRTNYLCLKAVDEFFSSGYWTLSEDDQSKMPAFIEWLQRSEDGDLDEYEGLSRADLARTGDECTGGRCPFRSRCFVYKARKRAFEANLVVANHALVLAEATTPAGGILPAYGRIVMDEAHNLESIATEYLSAEFSLGAVSRIVKRLLKHHPEASRLAAALLGRAEDFLAFLGTILPPKTENRRFNAATDYWPDVAKLAKMQGEFERALIALVNYLHDCEEKCDDPDFAQKLDADANALVALANEAAFVVKGERTETHAYWIEREHGERRARVRLVAAPLSVADDLRKLLYETKDSVILSSATLRVGNDFRYMVKRLGANERFELATATSPFDYLRQALVLAPDNLPDPAADGPAYAEALAKFLRELFTITNGRALVLFTSYEMMNEVSALAQPLFAEAGLELLVQGEELSREAMTRRLKEKTKTVLFGAQSFWEGVDVAGEALSCVVLARLPFAQIGDPIVEARGERIERNGGSAFRDYALPEAVIKFRQGFGRLIRSKSDRGVVVVTDSRIVVKNYGATFRKSIPASVHTVTSTEELLERVRNFFA